MVRRGLPWIVLVVAAADAWDQGEPLRQGLWMLIAVSCAHCVAGYAVRRIIAFRVVHAARLVVVACWLRSGSRKS